MNSIQKKHEILIFLSLLVSFTYVFPRWADPNQNSRLDMVVAVVEDKTFQIDKYAKNTVDYAKVGDHYYSDKAPGASFLGIPFYWTLRFFLELPLVDGLVNNLAANEAFQSTLNPEGTGINKQKVRFAIAQVFLSFLVSSIPTAFLGIFIFRVLGLWSTDILTRLIVVYTYALLTPAFTYAGAFYGHQLSAALLFLAFFILLKTEKFSNHSLILIGILLAYSFITEYPTILISVVLGGYLLRKLFISHKLLSMAWTFLGGLIILAPWMFYNSMIFGGPLNLGYSHSELWQEQHHTGFMSLTIPHWDAIWGITFSTFRGLFFYSPILLMGFPGFFLWLKAGRNRTELMIVGLIIVSMFLFNASSIMWWGGFAVGPRYLLPALPFWILLFMFPIQHWGNKRWFKAVFLTLSIISFSAVWGLTLAGQSYPSDTIMNPLVEYAFPNWIKGNIARNVGTLVGLKGFISIAPLLFIIALLLLAQFVLIFRKSSNTRAEKNDD